MAAIAAIFTGIFAMLILVDTRKADIRWEKPVNVKVGSGVIRRIKGPMDALNVLAHDVAPAKSPLHETARNDCCAALRRRKSLEEARASFVAALNASRSEAQ